MADFWFIYVVIGLTVFILNAREHWCSGSSDRNIIYTVVWPVVSGVLWFPLLAIALALVVWLKISGTPVKNNMPSIRDFV